MRFDLITLHPEICAAPVQHSIIGRARDAGHISVAVHDMRRWAIGRHRQADDTPYGGGSGMVLRVDVVDRAIDAVRGETGHVVLMEPSGVPFTQRQAVRLASLEHLVFVCGHYEGIDDRVRQHLVDETLSIGDYVLTGGELAALVVLDAVARLIPGVLGNADSIKDESFSHGLLEYPHFTRPRSYRGWDVPGVLISGHHARIARWRKEQARLRTLAIRPDLAGQEGSASHAGKDPDSGVGEPSA